MCLSLVERKIPGPRWFRGPIFSIPLLNKRLNDIITLCNSVTVMNSVLNECYKKLMIKLGQRYVKY